MQRVLYIFLIVSLTICFQVANAHATSDQLARQLEEVYLYQLAFRSNYFSPTAEQTVHPPQILKVDKASNGKRVGLKIGDEIHIELEANGSTGYQWYFDDSITDANLFEIVGHDRFEVKKSGMSKVGNPMTHIWKLKGKKRGSGFVNLKYYRKWEGSERAIKQFEIGLDIN
jgi:predicted secreted protein